MNLKRAICFLFVSLTIMGLFASGNDIFSSAGSNRSKLRALFNYELSLTSNYKRQDIVNKYFSLDVDKEEGWLELVDGQFYVLADMNESGGTKWNPEKKYDIEVLAYIELSDPDYSYPFKMSPLMGKYSIICTHIEISDDTWLYIYTEKDSIYSEYTSKTFSGEKPEDLEEDCRIRLLYPIKDRITVNKR